MPLISALPGCPGGVCTKVERIPDSLPTIKAGGYEVSDSSQKTLKHFKLLLMSSGSRSWELPWVDEQVTSPFGG